MSKNSISGVKELKGLTIFCTVWRISGALPVWRSRVRSRPLGDRIVQDLTKIKILKIVRQKKFEHNLYSLQKVLRGGTSIISHHYKVILTWFRPVPRPKPEKVGLIRPTGHLFPFSCRVTQLFLAWLVMNSDDFKKVLNLTWSVWVGMRHTRPRHPWPPPL